MDHILEILGYVNTASWLLAAVAAYKFRSIFKSSNKSWSLVMIGSIIMLVRQLMQFIPGFDANLDMQVIRYSVGMISGIILLTGFYKLNKEAKTLI